MLSAWNCLHDPDCVAGCVLLSEPICTKHAISVPVTTPHHHHGVHTYRYWWEGCWRQCGRVTLYHRKLPKLNVQKICHYLVWKMHFQDLQSFPATFRFLKFHFNYTKGFSKFIKEKSDLSDYHFFYLKQFFSQKWINRWEHWGPNASLDTKIGQIDLWHILMSYASFDIKWRIWHQMTHMTSKYDVSQSGQSWCLKKLLTLSNPTCWFNVV